MSSLRGIFFRWLFPPKGNSGKKYIPKASYGNLHWANKRKQELNFTQDYVFGGHRFKIKRGGAQRAEERNDTCILQTESHPTPNQIGSKPPDAIMMGNKVGMVSRRTPTQSLRTYPRQQDHQSYAWWCHHAPPLKARMISSTNLITAHRCKTRQTKPRLHPMPDSRLIMAAGAHRRGGAVFKHGKVQFATNSRTDDDATTQSGGFRDDARQY